MRLLRGLHNCQPQSTGCVATIGNFDGVHLGHQAIVAQVQKVANQLAVPSTVILFEPHPKEYFMPENCPARLSSLREKLSKLEKLGVEQVLVLKFNHRLAMTRAEEFVEDILVRRLRVKHLVVGDDFHFGFRREGNFELLQQMGQGRFSVEPTPSVQYAGSRVSSTRVRDLLASGQLQEAAALLGEPYSVVGRVGYGAQLGRQIGFPTANIAVNRRKPAISGVYLVRVYWQQDEQQHCYFGAANCGVKPSVDGKRFKIEVHIMKFKGDLYGRLLRVEFLRKIRDEQKFDSIDSLRTQISADVVAAQQMAQRFN